VTFDLKQQTTEPVTLVWRTRFERFVYN